MGRIDVHAEAAIARFAARDDDVVTRASLLRVGVASAAVDDRVRSGRLRPIHPGVSFAGHGELSPAQHHLAAVLAAEPDAWLAGGSAAEHWRTLSAAPGPPVVPRLGRHRSGPAGVRLRRTNHLPPDERTVYRGIPVTSSRRGSARLHALLSEAPGYTREGAERLLRSLVLKAQFPTPRFNFWLLGHHRDAVWPEQRLVIEVDGFAAHGTRAAFASVTSAATRSSPPPATAASASPWRQLTGEPEAIVARLAGAPAVG